MIISASRREDMPAFRPEFLAAILREEHTTARNPFNPRQMREVSLAPKDVKGLVLWSKNPAALLEEPLRGLLSRYIFYVQYTLNAYQRDIEPGVPPLAERLDTYRRLCDAFGRERVRWRYDPILLTPRDTVEVHIERFARITQALEGYADICTISFLDVYRHILPAIKLWEMRAPDDEEQQELARGFSAIAKERGIALCTCCEAGDFTAHGIRPGRCVDAAHLSRIAGRRIAAPKDPNQREGCLCVQAVDVGTYGTCGHGCRYCYVRQ